MVEVAEVARVAGARGRACCSATLTLALAPTLTPTLTLTITLTLALTLTLTLTLTLRCRRADLLQRQPERLEHCRYQQVVRE